MRFINTIVIAMAGFAMAQDAAPPADGATPAPPADGKMGGMKKGGGHSGAKGHNSNSTQALCGKMFMLESLQKLAANETALAARTKNNATKIEEIKAKASQAAPELKTLQDNSTLVGECTQIAAVAMTNAQCAHMSSLERLEKIAANETMLSQVTRNNATRAESFKKKAEEAKATLSTLQSNSTLTAFCAVAKDKMTCRQITRMQKTVDQANNQTFLEAKFKGNTTKADKFKAKAAKTEEKLKTLQSNSTLMDICSKQTTSNGRTSPSSDAPTLQRVGLSGALLAVFTAGFLLL